jgi:hypothetical protein
MERGFRADELYLKDGRAKVDLALANARSCTTSAATSPSAAPTGRSRALR